MRNDVKIAILGRIMQSHSALRTRNSDQGGVVGRDSAFGRRLADLRAERGLSLRELELRAHFSRGFLWSGEVASARPGGGFP
jgi:hypothetical protein